MFHWGGWAELRQGEQWNCGHQVHLWWFTINLLWWWLWWGWWWWWGRWWWRGRWQCWQWRRWRWLWWAKKTLIENICFPVLTHLKLSFIFTLYQNWIDHRKHLSLLSVQCDDEGVDSKPDQKWRVGGGGCGRFSEQPVKLNVKCMTVKMWRNEKIKAREIKIWENVTMWNFSNGLLQCLPSNSMDSSWRGKWEWEKLSGRIQTFVWLVHCCCKNNLDLISQCETQQFNGFKSANHVCPN